MMNTKQESSKRMDRKRNSVAYYKLFSFADSLDCLLMFGGTAGAVANGMSMPLMTLIFGSLVNSFGGYGDTKDVVFKVSKVALHFVYLSLGTSVASFLQVACWMVTGERQAARIRNLYLKTILRQEVGFFDKETNTGEIVERMSGDIVLIQDAIGEKVGKFIQLVATFLGGFLIAFARGWLLTIVMLSSIPFLGISGAISGLAMKKLAARTKDAYSSAAIVVEQTIGSIRTVASFTGEKRAMDKYNKSITRAYKSGVKSNLANGLSFGFIMLIQFGSYALAVWYGGKMIAEEGYSPGDVINIMFAVVTSSVSLGQASPCMSAFAAGQAAAFKVFETIRRKTEIDAYNNNGKQLDDIRGDIELRDIHFTYPSRPEEKIFNGFSLSIPSGTTIALVGQSGSGKSTVISLIERFYDPQAGEVRIDGINLKEFQLKWIRQKIGLVSQEPMLFASSIRDNIAYGKHDATAEEIRAAVELANAAKFIDKLPQGLDTMVGEHGTKLSGGQKQRVSIARALLKDPRLLLLDEATSALDSESERVVQEALDTVMINRTTVIVAHRLSTIKSADTIVVMHHGKIVEKGPHSELVKELDGAYSKLIQHQEINNVSENGSSIGQDGPLVHSGRNISSKRFSQSPIIQDSSGKRSTSGHSCSASSVVPTTMSPLETSASEPNTSTSAPFEATQEVSFHRLFLLNKTEIPMLLLGSIFAAISGMVFPAYGVVLSKVVKSYFEPADKIQKDSNIWALILVSLGAVSLFVNPSSSYLFGLAGCRLIRRIQSMCFEKAVYMEVSWFDEVENSSGAIGARLSSDTVYVRRLVGDSLALIVKSFSTAVAGLVVAFAASWQVSLVILAMLPLQGLCGYVQFKFISGSSKDAKKMYEEASQIANDAIGSIRTVASFCAEEKVMELYEKKCEGPMRKGISQGVISGIGYGVSFLLLYSVYACSFYAGSQLVADGKIDYSNVFQVFFALSMMAVAISLSSYMVPDISKAKAAVASVFAILDRKSKIDSSNDSGITKESVKGEVEFHNVSFKYPARPDMQIFKDLCLAIHSGKTVALVGESGSGKSTMISLLQRFYDPDSGHITLDGIEIRKLQLKWLRQQMGLVSQEPVLFNDTIRANISYGKDGEATESEIVAAAELANAHKFISSLQQGYDTIVGERGVQLSGGQKQRVAIARAIVKAPKILLLDEATSALDSESEIVVQNALDQVMVNRTTIVVAHRLSTIKGADLIAVVKNGAIAEKGNHETLIGIKDGIYASLAALHATGSA